MAVFASWDGATVPALTGDAASVISDPSVGHPAPALRFSAHAVAYYSLPVTAPAPGSMRFRFRTIDGTGGGGSRPLRYRNVEIRYLTGNTLSVIFTGGSGSTNQAVVVKPGTWLTIELNLDSATVARCRIWAEDGTLIYDRKNSFTGRTGGYFGNSAGAFGSGSFYHFDDIIITDTAADIDPQPVEIPGVRAHSGGAWIKRQVKAFVEGAWRAVPIRYFGGSGWGTYAQQIDAAGSVAQIQRVLSEAGAERSLLILLSEGTIGQVTFANPTTIDDAHLRTAAKATIEAILSYPPTLLQGPTGGMDGWRIFLGRTLMLVGTERSGSQATMTVSMNTDLTAAQLAMLDDRHHNAIFVIHHEFAHGFYENKTGAALTTFKNEMAAAQPPGHTWGTQDDTFTGEHPVGFARGYGRTNADEDQADIVGWLLTPHLWARDGGTWFVDDPYLAAKAAATRKWLTSLGFTGL